MENIEREVVAPAGEFTSLIHNVKKVITKRSHKLIDYDRHRESFKKMSEKADRDIKDEKKLGAIETQLDAATREYNEINSLLISQLPILLSLRIKFIDPCFKTLYWYQLKVYTMLQQEFSAVVSHHFPSSLNAMEIFDKHEAHMTEMLAGLQIVKRPFRPSVSGSTEPALPEYSPTTAAQDNAASAVQDISAKYSFSTLHQQAAPKNVKEKHDIVVALYDYSRFVLFL